MAARVALGCAILFPEGCSEMNPFEQHCSPWRTCGARAAKPISPPSRACSPAWPTPWPRRPARATKRRSRPSRRTRRPSKRRIRTSPSCGRRPPNSRPALTKNLQGADQANPHRGRDAGQDLRPARMVLGHQRSRPDAPAHGGGAAPGRPVERRAQVHRRVQRLGGHAPAQPRAQHGHAGGLDEGGRRFRQDAERASRAGRSARVLARGAWPCGWRPPTRCCSRRSGRRPS